MRVAVERLGVLAPGLPDWASARQALRGETVYTAAPLERPRVDLLPPNEQRRLTSTARMALALAQAACEGLPADIRARIPCVFASAVGDSDITDRLCTALGSPGKPVSPTQFHNSVHNAPAGYWAIATGNQAASTSLCGGEYTATAGLLEAASRCLVQRSRVLLVVYDYEPPARLVNCVGVHASFGMAMLLCPAAQAAAAHHTLHLQASTEPATTLPPPWEAIRQSNPAARNLGLLQALARTQKRVILPYGPTRQLAVDITHGD